MTNLSPLVPHILNETRIPRWPTRARLLGVVAARTWDGESWTPLGVAELMRYYDESGHPRTRRGAEYDREILQKMAEVDRILVRRGGRSSGRYPDVFRIAGTDLRHLAEWRRVPWVTSAKAATRSLRAHMAPAGSGFSRVGAGQRLFLSWVGPHFEGSGASPLSVKPPDTTPEVPNKTPNPPGETGPFTQHNPEPGPRSSASPLLSSSFKGVKPSLPHPPTGAGDGNEAGEGGREVFSTEDRKRAWSVKERLEDALAVRAEALGRTPVTIAEEWWEEVRGIATSYEGDLEILLARCDSYGGKFFSPRPAIADIRNWIAAGCPSERRSSVEPTRLRPERWRVSVEWTEPDGIRRRHRTSAWMFDSDAEAEAWAESVEAGDVILHEDQGDVRVLELEPVG